MVVDASSVWINKKQTNVFCNEVPSPHGPLEFPLWANLAQGVIEYTLCFAIIGRVLVELHFDKIV